MRLLLKRRDGFGHVAFSVNDVYETSESLEKAGVKFQRFDDNISLIGFRACGFS